MRVLEIVRAALGAIYLHGAITNLQFALLNPRGRYNFQSIFDSILVVRVGSDKFIAGVVTSTSAQGGIRLCNYRLTLESETILRCYKTSLKEKNLKKGIKRGEI